MSETTNDKKKAGYVDNGWPAAEGDHAVSEFAAPLVGALSPFGDVQFPEAHIPYVHPNTRINR
ncbi:MULTISPECIES: hypothetical protein [Tsukamurella]|uniref:Uncharacterized protein n=1 Tax=Tsukamurella strandjordii TaxID=147577 RepID=A0AA90N875_9ACTN|nr:MULTISPECIES: hypothetical protein [Tsukamurella]MDP0396625.1 hypothetical protein [Tsukamurella strandjordii]GIZ96427.1 hypothetical protein TTY48_10390 [Tsukamurella sp. TY48]